MVSLPKTFGHQLPNPDKLRVLQSSLEHSEGELLPIHSTSTPCLETSNPLPFSVALHLELVELSTPPAVYPWPICEAKRGYVVHLLQHEKCLFGGLPYFPILLSINLTDCGNSWGIQDQFYLCNIYVSRVKTRAHITSESRSIRQPTFAVEAELRSLIGLNPSPP